MAVARFIGAVIDALRESKWRKLRDTGDYRRVLHYAESDFGQAGIGLPPLSTLRERGIQVALGKLFARTPDREMLRQCRVFDLHLRAAHPACDSPQSEECAVISLRVIQAACVFSELLGQRMTVRAFPSFRPKEEDDTGLMRMELTSPDAGLATVKSHLRAKPRHHDSWCALTVYEDDDAVGGDGAGNLEPRAADVIAALQALTLIRSPKAAPGDAAGDRTRLYTRYGLGETEAKELRAKCEESKADWPLIGAVAAESVRDIRHEGKTVAANLAIGTDVEFRQVLTPIFNLGPDDQTAEMPRVTAVLTESKDEARFQRELRTFVRRNYSYIEGTNRFVCLAASSEHGLQLRYIADLRDEYHAATFSEMVSRVVPLSGVTLARVDSSGRARVVARTRDSRRETDRGRRRERADIRGGNGPDLVMLECDALGRWRVCATPGDNPEVVPFIRIGVLRRHLHQALGRSDRDGRFLDRVLIPVIEAVSESPSEGATIVLLDRQSQPESRRKYFQLPESRIAVDLHPDSNVKFVGRETFRRLIIQDGATIIDTRTGEIIPRAQLVAGPSSDPLLHRFCARCGDPARGKVSEWGTRHISALRFIRSLRGNDRRRMSACCVVVSQDGDVHYLRPAGDPAEVIQHVFRY